MGASWSSVTLSIVMYIAFFLKPLVLFLYFGIRVGGLSCLIFVHNAPYVNKSQPHLCFEPPNIEILPIEFVNDSNTFISKWYHLTLNIKDIFSNHSNIKEEIVQAYRHIQRHMINTWSEVPSSCLALLFIVFFCSYKIYKISQPLHPTSTHVFIQTYFIPYTFIIHHPMTTSNLIVYFNINWWSSLTYVWVNILTRLHLQQGVAFPWIWGNGQAISMVTNDVNFVSMKLILMYWCYCKKGIVWGISVHNIREIVIVFPSNVYIYEWN